MVNFSSVALLHRLETPRDSAIFSKESWRNDRSSVPEQPARRAGELKNGISAILRAHRLDRSGDDRVGGGAVRSHLLALAPLSVLAVGVWGLGQIPRVPIDDLDRGVSA